MHKPYLVILYYFNIIYYINTLVISIQGAHKEGVGPIERLNLGSQPSAGAHRELDSDAAVVEVLRIIHLEIEARQWLSALLPSFFIY